MREYPYVLAPNSLKKYLQTIQTVGVPEKVTVKLLEAQGFKSKNDRAILSMLKFLGFTTESGTPVSERWGAYRDRKRAPYVLGQAIRGAYPDLFAMYPDAYRRDDEALRNFIRANIRDSEGVLSRIVATFKAICDLAKFDQPDAEEEVASFSSNGSSNGEGKDASSGSTIPISAMPSQSKDGTLTLNINIELHLPATQEAEVYDKLFASLKRHLLEK